MPYIATIFVGASNTPKAVVVADALWCGVCKPEAYGGQALDYSYSVAMAETMGRAHCGGVPMAIGIPIVLVIGAISSVLGPIRWVLDDFGNPSLRQLIWLATFITLRRSNRAAFAMIRSFADYRVSGRPRPAVQPSLLTRPAGFGQ